MRKKALIRVLLLAVLVAWGVSSVATLRTGDILPGPSGFDLSLREGRLVAATAPDSGLMWLVPPQRVRWSPGWPHLDVLYVEDCPVGTVAGVPLWAPAVVLGGLTLIPRRRLPGRCRCCGYEIGIEAAPVCPECGKPQQRHGSNERA